MQEMRLSLDLCAYGVCVLPSVQINNDNNSSSSGGGGGSSSSSKSPVVIVGL